MFEPSAEQRQCSHVNEQEGLGSPIRAAASAGSIRRFISLGLQRLVAAFPREAERYQTLGSGECSLLAEVGALVSLTLDDEDGQGTDRDLVGCDGMYGGVGKGLVSRKGCVNRDRLGQRCIPDDFRRVVGGQRQGASPSTVRCFAALVGVMS